MGAEQADEVFDKGCFAGAACHEVAYRDDGYVELCGWDQAEVEEDVSQRDGQAVEEGDGAEEDAWIQFHVRFVCGFKAD